MIQKILFSISLLLIGSGVFIYYGSKNTNQKLPHLSISQSWDKIKSFSTKRIHTDQPKNTTPAPLTGLDSLFPPKKPEEQKKTGTSVLSLKSTLRWPPLVLSGFGRGSNNQEGFAIINGKQVLVGSVINDVTILEILDHGIVIKYKDETKTLTVDSR